MKKFACVLLLTLAAMIGCDRTPGVRSSQGGGGAANAPATERSPPRRLLPNRTTVLVAGSTSAEGQAFRMAWRRDWPWDSHRELRSELPWATASVSCPVLR